MRGTDLIRGVKSATNCTLVGHMGLVLSQRNLSLTLYCSIRKTVMHMKKW